MRNDYLITASLVLYQTNREDLINVLCSVSRSEIKKLYVIDNSPTDKLRRMVSEHKGIDIEYIHGHGNIGFGGGNNIALKKSIESGAKYHIVLNPDIIFESDVISKIATYMDSNEDIGMVLPKVIYPDGRLQYLCKLLPTPVDIFARRILPSKYIEHLNYKFEMHFMGYDKIWNCPILSGCFMFMRTSILQKVGLFDPRFFMYFEDFDLMRRLHMVSKTVFYPNVEIIHNHASEHRHNSKLLKESLKSAVKYFNKWGWFFDKDRSRINHNAQHSSGV